MAKVSSLKVVQKTESKGKPTDKIQEKVQPNKPSLKSVKPHGNDNLKEPVQFKNEKAPFKPAPKVEKITEALIQECREKLLVSKSDLLNRVKETRGKLDQFERGGDEADQTMRLLAEQEMLNLTDRLRSQLLEVESALSRIENGSFGLCEETEEFIEVERLKAIPWTRLSIEGAEIRESMNKRYARS